MPGESNPTLELTRDLIRDVCNKIGMRYEGLHAALWEFPAFGLGGEGFTYVQPIMTSFIAGDRWKFSDGEEALYLVIVSCEPYDHIEVGGIIQEYGLDVVDILFGALSAQRNKQPTEENQP